MLRSFWAGLRSWAPCVVFAIVITAAIVLMIISPFLTVTEARAEQSFLIDYYDAETGVIQGAFLIVESDHEKAVNVVRSYIKELCFEEALECVTFDELAPELRARAITHEDLLDQAERSEEDALEE